MTTDIIHESDLRMGRRINLTLVGDTWVDAVGQSGHMVNAEIEQWKVLAADREGHKSSRQLDVLNQQTIEQTKNQHPENAQAELKQTELKSQS